MNETELGILQRVRDGEPLRHSDRLYVNSLIEKGLMHVNPVYKAGEVCPYTLTKEGWEALKGE